jgi:hypothetical protein
MTEHETWVLTDKTLDVRTFMISVTERDNNQITGNICETELFTMQENIREHSFFFTHLDAEMKDGTSRRFTLEEWDSMDRIDREQLKSWVKHYNPADEMALDTHIKNLYQVHGEKSRSVTAGEFLTQINESYMAGANNPQPALLRVTLEAAKEILAQNNTDVFRLMEKGAEKLSPVDAAKTGLWFSVNREFAVKPKDLTAVEKWAKRTVKNILQQTERGERSKSKDKEEL